MPSKEVDYMKKFKLNLKKLNDKINNSIEKDKLSNQFNPSLESNILQTEQDIKYEDREICKKCGGYCCKKCGCDYFISDFESMKIDYLEQILLTGEVSIVATLYFNRLNNNKIICIPTLYLRARNNNRDVIDLLSFKTKCAQLTDFGCSYDINKRPSGGVTLIPSADGFCYSKVDRREELKKLKPYQKILERLVKRHTQMSVTEKLKKDVETLVYNLLTENYQDSFEEEIEEISKLIPLLEECFPNECKKAILRYQNEVSLSPVKSKCLKR